MSYSGTLVKDGTLRVVYKKNTMISEEFSNGELTIIING